MLTKGGIPGTALPTTIPWPELGMAYEVAPHSEMVRFYTPAPFAFPYRLLQSLKLDGNTLILRYPQGSVILVGTELHTLFVLLTQHRICAVIQNQDPFPKPGQVTIHSMEFKVRKKPAPPKTSEDHSPDGDQPIDEE